jgi:hypothetical protein
MTAAREGGGPAYAGIRYRSQVVMARLVRAIWRHTVLIQMVLTSRAMTVRARFGQ